MKAVPATAPRLWHPAAVRSLCAGAVFAVCLAVYVRTLAPTVTFVDSGELIVAASSLGVAHPPGFPLYVVLAHLATWLPFGTVALRVHVLSALCAAGAAAMLTVLVGEIVLSLRKRSPTPAGRSGGSARHRSTRDAHPTPPHAISLAWSLLVSGCAFGFSRTLWSYATLAEVYTLNTLLVVIVLFLVVRWRRRVGETKTAGAAALYGAAAVFGLALGVHHVTVALTAPALALLVYSAAGWEILRARRVLPLVLCACAGLLVYLYLPFAAARAPLFNWGDPHTLQRVWWHVTGRQYQSYFSFAPTHVGSEAAAFVRRAAREFGPWWIPALPLLAAIGFASLWRRDRPLCGALALIMAADLLYAFGYGIAEDKEAYYLPCFVAIATAAGIGAWEVTRLLDRHPARLRLGPLAASASLVVVPVIGFVSNLPFSDRSRYTLAQDYVDNILRAIEPNGLLLTLDWQVWAPMLYTRTIDAQRRDVVVIDVNLLRRSWYFDYLHREYPALMEQTAPQVTAFLKELRHWEQDPEVYERDRALNRRISLTFVDMILAFVRQHMPSGPVYITQDLALNRQAEDRDVTQALTTQYALLPQGLVFQLLSDRGFREPAEVQWQMRGLADGTLRFEPDDVVRIKVFPVYVSMLYNRGRYLALHGHHERAIAAYQQALALDPTFAPAQRALAESSGAVREPR